MDRALLRRAVLRRAIGYPLILATLLGLFWFAAVRMPGRSFDGPLRPLTQGEARSASQLERDVILLSGTIGERDLTRPLALDSAALHIAGSGGVTRDFRNIEATLPGTQRPEEIVVVGAHYDSVIESPGADDNASGTASLLELARIFADRPQEHTLRFVAFSNEEPPFFWTPDMGSVRYAGMAKARVVHGVGRVIEHLARP